MSLSGVLHAIGWFFSFLATAYGLLFASIDQKWIKTSFFEKLVSTPGNTLIVAIFFAFIAAISFILSAFHLVNSILSFQYRSPSHYLQSENKHCYSVF